MTLNLDDNISVFSCIKNEKNQLQKVEKNHSIRCKDNYNQWLPRRIFFRGESGEYGDTSNVASVFRRNYQEHSLYHFYMSKFPRMFNGMGNFSKLTYMQHFGLPTCLLDITSNFLVALYFACCHIYSSDSKVKDKDRSGIVWIILPKLKSDQDSSSLYYIIYNNNCDTIDILSTLALLKTDAQHEVFKKVQNFNNHFCSKRKNSFFRSLVHGNYSVTENNIIDHSKSKIGEKYAKVIRSYGFRRLLHNINQKNYDFQPLIDFNHLFKPRIVQPAINNQRIKSQQGYFILENYRSNNKTKNKNQIPRVERYIHNDIKKYFDFYKIKIPNQDKEKILRELDIRYGINRAQLFPDYENVAQYVKNEYKYLK